MTEKLRWPHRCEYLNDHGYVVWRDVFEGAMRCSLRDAVLAHKVAAFVTESEAEDYCDYRNAMTAVHGTDDVQAIKPIEALEGGKTDLGASGALGASCDSGAQA